MLTPAEIDIEKVAVAVFDTESVAVTEKLEEPVVVGLPLSTPAADRLKPAGSVEPPATAHM
jgi:hypothetical protein